MIRGTRQTDACSLVLPLWARASGRQAHDARTQELADAAEAAHSHAHALRTSVGAEVELAQAEAVSNTVAPLN
jgi:hypothetical protein|eukprot:COSAG01_NODE_24566_length_774_cov_1.567407_2_plen_73_part_00